MKILYVYNTSSKLSGVNNKIIAKLKFLKQCGIDLTILSKGTAISNPEFIGFNVVYPQRNGTNRKKLGRFFNLKFLNFFNTIISDKYLADYYERELAEIDFDFVIMRYGTSNFHFNRLVKKHKHKFVFEHNTIELEQLKLKYKNVVLSQSWISYMYLSEKYFGPKTLKNSAGIIGVTNEITSYEINRINTKNTLPLHTTISNGIDVLNYPLNFPNYCEDELNLFVILGVDAEWNGLDRIINGLNNYKGEKKVTLYVIGTVCEIKSPNVVYKGYMNLEQINKFLETHNIHLGIATLALHRKGLREASVLKAREYLARGIPFILGYNDTDLENNKGIEKFIHRVISDDTPIDINSVVEFYKHVFTIDNYPVLIKDFALKNVDMLTKAQQYADFLKKIYLAKNNSKI